MLPLLVVLLLTNVLLLAHSLAKFIAEEISPMPVSSSSAKKKTAPTLRSLAALLGAVTLALCAPIAVAQTWVSTATKALQLNNATVIGSLQPSTSLHIVVGLQERNASLVQPTLKRMLTPGDPLFGTSLTVDQFIQQFAPTSAQVQAVKTYLSKAGFTSIAVADNQLMIEATGTASKVEAAFNTTLAQFSQNGKTVFANTSDAQVPLSLQGTVAAVLGLNNMIGMHTPLLMRGTDPCTPPDCPIPDPTNALNGYTPQDYQIAYDAAEPGITTTKNGPTVKQKIATGGTTHIAILAEGDLGTVSPATGVIADLRSYEKLYNLPQVTVNIVNVGVPSSDTSGADEWDLDSQTSTGIAQQVGSLTFYVATSLTDSDMGLAINKFASVNKAKALNISIGECEVLPYLDGAMLVDDQAFNEAALQGQTAFASSDDNGSACPVLPTNGVPVSGPPFVSYPASSPYVISVGGTDLFTNSNFSYDEETAWNAGGGGISAVENSPFWQSYAGSGTLPVVPSSEDGDRGVPDVAMCADPNTCGANIFVSGALEVVGGTSLASPLSVGSWARIESAHKGKLGFAGPLIYQLANGAPTLTSPYFNDVILGGNGAFTALPGWDYTTGLGSWDIFAVDAAIPSTYPQ
jgi:pseudomonalisin